jgi:hypothetical protein
MNYEKIKIEKYKKFENQRKPFQKNPKCFLKNF